MTMNSMLRQLLVLAAVAAAATASADARSALAAQAHQQAVGAAPRRGSGGRAPGAGSSAPQLRTAAAQPVIIVSARLLSCEWPQAGRDGGDSPAGSPAASVQVECVFADADPTVPSAPPSAVRSPLAVRGIPLEQCALGAPLRLPYLLRLRAAPPGAAAGAALELVSSTPLVGVRHSAEEQAGGSVVLRQCLVTTPGDDGQG
jgi:hypothetical protein